MEEQRRQQEEQEVKEARLKELKKARYEKRKAEKREFTARKKAGLLTPEELEAEEKRLAHSREWQKEWREKRKAAESPKPPKKKSIKELMELEKTGAELAKKRAHQSQATKKSRQKMYEEAATGNPEAVERYENYLVTRRESYHRKKQEAERTA